MSEYLKLKRLEYIVTYRCTSQCIHCCNGTHRASAPAHVDKKSAVEALSHISETYALDSVMTFGGEPLLYPDIVTAIHEKAASLGIEKRQVITNGKWDRNGSKTREIAERLSACGVNQVYLSIDAFHQQHVSLDTLRSSAEALLASGIEDISWNPCWLESSDANNLYNTQTREYLDRLADLPIRTGSGNIVFPAGNAIHNLAEFFVKRFSFGISCCHELPYMDCLDQIESICLEPNGDIPLCQAFKLGNIYETDIRELLKSYNPYQNADMKEILENGIPQIAETGDSMICDDSQGYYTVCDMCCDLRSARSR